MLRVTVTATGTAHDPVPAGPPLDGARPAGGCPCPLRITHGSPDFRSFADAERIEAGDSGFDGR